MIGQFKAAAAAVGAAVLMATGFTATAASASTAGVGEAWDDCAWGHVCLWDDPGFSGEKIIDWAPRRHGEVHDFPASAVDRASSMRNNSNFVVRLYSLHHGMGFHICAPARFSHGDFRQLGWDNTARSIGTTLHPVC
ncbi:peptidase inhibitor family I36 protein [Glycomyces arizonensis]|uniref:peptidase inhibitor family I36 protein n=1 Tax=Glycomyces arizonensis TaxID=256035 RepID=UPI0003F99440|nr:peptidase inhibitor family I36 protein [Glycomyces arizonensis]